MSVVDPLSLALGQISFAITDLTKKNYKITVTEIHEVTVKFLGPFWNNDIRYYFVNNLVLHIL